MGNRQCVSHGLALRNRWVYHNAGPSLMLRQCSDSIFAWLHAGSGRLCDAAVLAFQCSA